MSDTLAMGSIMTDEAHSYLEQSLQAEFCFARRDRCAVEPLSPWKRNDCHVLSLVLHGGIVRTWFEDAPDQTITRNPGQACLLLDDEKRRVLLVPDASGSPFDLLALGFRAKVFGAMDVLSFYHPPRLLGQDDSARLRDVMMSLVKLEREDSTSLLNRVAMHKRACFEVLHLIVSASSLRTDTARRLMQFGLIRPAIDLISNHYRESLTIDRLATCCFLSRSQFHHVFKESTGQSPYEYQISLRLREAKRLLIGGSCSVAGVGTSVGWRDPFHFSRIFRKNCGCSPRAFRARCRKMASDLSQPTV